MAAAPSKERSAQLREVLVAAQDCPDPAQQARMRGEVVVEYLPVAQSIAGRYTRRGIDRDELNQLANLGLLKAVRGWRPGVSEDFLQYAVPTMVGEIKRYFRDHLHTVRPVRTVAELRPSLADAENDHWQRHGTRPTDEQLARAVGTQRAQIREARAAMSVCRPASLDELHAADSPATASWGASDPNYEHVENRMTVQHLLTCLTDRERRIIDLRFTHSWSQSQIAGEMGVSQMQISRWLGVILGKLAQAGAAA